MVIDGTDKALLVYSSVNEIVGNAVQPMLPILGDHELMFIAEHSLVAQSFETFFHSKVAQVCYHHSYIPCAKRAKP